MYIMKLTPAYQERLWGGQQLSTIFHKEIPFEHTGESWEISCHENGLSQISNGAYAGKTLKEIIDANPETLLGYKKSPEEKFPLLLKFIDAKDLLSVQVHPEDAYARLHENGELGKSEAWYIVDAEPGATLIVGLNDGVTKQTFIEAVSQNRLSTVMKQLPVSAGDVINIPAGLLHAIGAGILLAEVQQNSDTTYRVYDWDRVGLDGTPREMHLEKSLDVIDFEGKHPTTCVEGLTLGKTGYDLTYYISNPYFALVKLEVKTQYESELIEDQFELFMCVEGEATVICSENIIKVQAGDSFMIPASIEDYQIKGEATFIKTYCPKSGQEMTDVLLESGFIQQTIDRKTAITV